jgi:hypothetical protein
LDASQSEALLRPFQETFVFMNGNRRQEQPPQAKEKHGMKTQELQNETVKHAVRERYGRIVAQGGDCGCAPTCCSPGATATQDAHDVAAVSQGLGYSSEETGAVPDGSNLGLGCGNPQAIAALKPGETVLDLGSGAGFANIRIVRKGGSDEIVGQWFPGRSVEDYVASASIEAVKPTMP